MSSTLLQLVSQATTEMGLSVPTTVIGNTNADVVQTLGLAQACGYELQREWQWQAITKQYIFTAPYYSYTGTSTSGSTTLTGMSSVAGIVTNPTYFMVTGTNVPQDCFVTAADAGAATVTLNQAATASGSGTFVFSQVLFPQPSDFDRLVDRTQWDKSKHWEMLGPETAQQWEWLRSGYISTGPRIRYRMLGGYFAIWPPLGSTESLSYEYVSNLWVVPTGGYLPTKTAFSVDTDTCIFPDRLMVLGIKLKYFEIKGFDTTALYRDYTKHLDIAKGSEAGSPTLSMAPRVSTVLIGWDNIPDSNYGS